MNKIYPLFDLDDQSKLYGIKILCEISKIFYNNIDSEFEKFSEISNKLVLLNF